MVDVIGRAAIQIVPNTARFAVQLRNDLARVTRTVTDSFVTLATQALAGGALALGGAAQNLTGALALIPAVGAEAAVTLGALAVGFQGVGKAIKDSGDPKKFAKDLEKLSPEARKAAVAVKDLGVQAGAFRVAVQDALFKDMDATITKLGNVLLPGVKKSFVDITTEVNHGARAFAIFAESKQTVADLNTVFANTKLSLRALTPAGIALSTALRDIATVGSGFLPLLADSLRRASESFAAFIAKARDSGQLDAFFAKGVATLQVLLDIVKNVAGALHSLFSSASEAGVGFLQTVDNIAQGLNDFLKTDVAKTGLANFLTSAKDAGKALLPVLKAVFDLFATQVAPILSDIAVTIGPGVTVFVNGVRDALKTAAPGIHDFAQGFSDLLRAVAPALPAIGHLASVLGTVLGGVMTRLGPVLAHVVEVIADALTKALSNPKLIDGVVAIAQAFGDILVALAPILPGLAELAGVVLKALADILVIIGPPLADMAKLFVDALAPILPDIAGAFVDLAKALLPIVEELLGPLLDLFKALLPFMKPVLELIIVFLRILEPLIRILGIVIDLISKIIGVVGKGAEAALKLSNIFVAALTGDSQKIHDAMVEQIAGEAVPAAVEALGEVGSAVVDLHRGIFTFVGELKIQMDDATGVNERFAKNTADAFNDAGNSITDVARHLISEVFPGLSNGIFTFVSDVITGTSDATGANERFAHDSAQAYADFLTSATSTVVKLVNILFPNFDAIGKAGSGAFQQIEDSANRAFLVTVKQSRDVLLEVAQIFRGADFSEAGSSITGSLAQGMVSSRAQLLIQRAARQVIETVANWFPHSPAKVGPFSGAGWTPFRGRALVEGFADGISGSRGVLDGALAGLFGGSASGLPSVSAPNVPTRVGAFSSSGGAGPRGTTAAATAAAGGDSTHVQVFIGDQELTQLVDGVVVKRDRDLRRRALSGTGRAS